MPRAKEQLQDNLFLNRYYWSLFGIPGKPFESLKDFKEEFGDEEKFKDYRSIEAYILDEKLKSKISEYNENIQEYMDVINSKREKQIQLKYFQYLAILFVEIHLDRYFEDSKNLLEEINEYFYDLNERNILQNDVTFDNENVLRKIAIWSATGSGKTILMHINYLQILRYLKDNGQMKEVENFFLITPGEQMSAQHQEEMDVDSIKNERFSPTTFSSGNLSRWSNKVTSVKVLDNHKMSNGEDGKKSKSDGRTIDVERLGTKNIVFVDEGHKGNKTESSKWKKNRNALISDYGFMFEYSATFSQSIGQEESFNEYSKSIIFDYRYKYFHDDGYGKDYQILNLKKSEQNLKEYLTGALLSFYEQKMLFNGSNLYKKMFNIENPLMIFVGSKVAGEKSDIASVIEFMVDFINDEERYTNYIEKIITDNSDVKEEGSGDSLFKKKLKNIKNIPSEEIYGRIMREIFYAGDNRKLNILKLDAEGEIGLKLGDKWFGVINVGEPNKLITEIQSRCGDKVYVEKSEHKSLFNEVDKHNSPINFILGAKKFIEGWNCFRVSCMGIMNMGKTEGAQIIQLFGRGVRLWGFDWLLKRSSHIKSIYFENPPESIEELETLKIFGLKANYMETFNKILETEMGSKKITETIEIKSNFPEDEILYIPTLKKRGDEFYDEKKEIIIPLDDKILYYDLESSVKIIESIKSEGPSGGEENLHPINEDLINSLDFQRILLKLKEFCTNKKMINISFSFSEVEELIKKMKFGIRGNKKLIELSESQEVDKLKKIEMYVFKSLKKYVFEKFGKEKRIWEGKNYEYEKLMKGDKKIMPSKEYTLKIDASKWSGYEDELESIREKISEFESKEDDLGSNNSFARFMLINKHLFHPLIYVDDNNKEVVSVFPDSLVKSELKFLEIFVSYLKNNWEEIGFDKIFLLRNLPRTGTGFSQNEGRFFPDFILWCIRGNKQYVTFVDPKGIGARGGLTKDSEKIKLYEEIKRIGEEIGRGAGGKKIVLNSFIFSDTLFDDDIKRRFEVEDKAGMAEMNVLFLQDKEECIEKMFEKMI